MSSSRFTAVLSFVVCVWALLAWFFLRPPSLIEDWNGWRQADTQTIALNLAKPGGRILHPQIAWGGDGPGYVEAEFQLYPALFAPILRLVGPVEWPGQAISLALYALAGLVLGVLLRENYGSVPSILGVGAFLSTRCALYLATSVQPEALAVLLFVVAWWCFLRFERSHATPWIVGFAAAGAVAMIVRPGAAQLGIASFIVLAARSQRLLRSRRVWAAWVFMLVVLLAYFAFARGIYQQYGNTFGLLSGGDSKLPSLEQLFKIGRQLDAFTVLIQWGLGTVGAVCLVALTVRGLGHAVMAGLAAGSLGWMLVSFRYSASVENGSHYPVLAGVLGAWCVARLARRWPGPPRGAGLYALLAGALLVQYGFSFHHRRTHALPDKGASCVASLAFAARGAVPSGGLVVVRGPFSYDETWDRANNFEDPRFFYATNTRGWVLGADEDDPQALAGYIERGATVYAEPESRGATPNTADWLDIHATLLARTACGAAWSLPSPASPTGRPPS